MADLVLPDGQEITFDLRAITTKEYKSMFDGRTSEKSGDEVLAKACHMEYDELVALPYEDYKRIIKHFFKKCNTPLSDPNDSGNEPT